jgi:hypothetical protein
MKYLFTLILVLISLCSPAQQKDTVVVIDKPTAQFFLGVYDSLQTFKVSYGGCITDNITLELTIGAQKEVIETYKQDSTQTKGIIATQDEEIKFQKGLVKSNEHAAKTNGLRGGTLGFLLGTPFGIIIALLLL